HLVVQTPDANLSRAMHWFNVSYSAWYNTRHQRTGPVFQGRFKSILTENVAWAYELSVYVHLNPLRIKGLELSKRDQMGARLGQGKVSSDEVLKERLSQLRSYRWSSYRAYAGYCKVPEWLEVTSILELASKQASDRIRAYRQDVRTRLVEGADPDKLDSVRDRVAIGSAAFLTAVKGGFAPIGRESDTKRDLRKRLDFDDIIRVVDGMGAESWETLRSRHGDPRKWVVLRVARRYTGMTLSELGQGMGELDYAAVGMGLRRLDKKLKDSADLRHFEAKLVQMLNVET
ncbi:MAG: hypothetical protein HQ523_10195, partial [Lentisphaerae bacterium]|nr:hypothetical protein [Lentisphaerota bacterium]